MEERYRLVSLLLLFFSVFFSVFSLDSSQSPQDQRSIMSSLFHNLNVSLKNSNLPPNSTDPNFCNWSGVTCSSNSSVVEKLDFSGLGSIDNSSSVAGFFGDLCRLHSLQSLDLSRNDLSSIPESFFSGTCGLSALKYLNLSFNKVSGLMSNFSGFASLETLDFSHNMLEGDVGPQLDDLAGLKSLNLSFNSFSGAIPSKMNALVLEELVLSANQFQGQIPSNIPDYINLRILDLSQNNISGTIPQGIEGLSKLQTLVLSSNNLIGNIPSSLSLISTLYRFAANLNAFTGAIPSGLTRHVKILDLSFNQLVGEIPSDLLSFPLLESVDLTKNTLRGSIPTNLSQKLSRLRLGWNSLSGAVPEAIGNLAALTYLELDGNHLSSQIPLQIGNCKNLQLLNLASNKMTGGLPNELGNLQKLVELKLESNSITGNIPDGLFKLAKLNLLNLSLNSMTGVIPSAISNLSGLQNLDLHSNEFSGAIPGSISSLTYLKELQLGNNHLNGTIPRMPGTLAIALNLSNNLFSGPIPIYLSELSDLEVLDLSNNQFSGQVPYPFSSMKSLTLIDLSNNDLSGTLPPFKTYVIVVTSGNKDLKVSSDGQYGNKQKHTVLIIVLPIVGAVVGLSLLAVVLMMMMSSRGPLGVKHESPRSRENAAQVVVSGHFITADSTHKSSIDFANTMEAVCDPRNIMHKTQFSTYYKVVMPNGLSYSVKKLNLPDKIFQKGTHERFGMEMEILGKLSSTNIMVPLAYVLTEDSAYLFYKDVHKGTVYEFLHKNSGNSLDWPSRYSIMLGVAQGLTFLHGCTKPVLLLDLSTKSIQLKSLKEPQIGEIELCKVIDPSKSTGSISTIAGSVGYIPPEYAYTMKVTMAGNVYSFGVVLLELLTGKPSMRNGVELAKWALSYSARAEEREQILDPKISKTSMATRNQMLSVLKVALACVNASPEARPKMRNALRMLLNAK